MPSRARRKKGSTEAGSSSESSPLSPSEPAVARVTNDRLDAFQPPPSQMTRSPHQPSILRVAAAAATSSDHASSGSPPDAPTRQLPWRRLGPQQPFLRSPMGSTARDNAAALRRSPPPPHLGFMGMPGTDLESDDVFRLPVGSFTEDSPPRRFHRDGSPRGSSVESDGGMMGGLRRTSPRASPFRQQQHPFGAHPGGADIYGPPYPQRQGSQEPLPGMPIPHPGGHPAQQVRAAAAMGGAGGGPMFYPVRGSVGQQQQQLMQYGYYPPLYYAQAATAADHWSSQSPPSSQQAPMDESEAAGSSANDRQTTTPEKKNPFRSPPADNRKLQASPPLFQQGSPPNIAGCGSFGMDTPLGTTPVAGDFSPMMATAPPSFAGGAAEAETSGHGPVEGSQRLELPRSSPPSEFAVPGGPPALPGSRGAAAAAQASPPPYGFVTNDFSPFGLKGISGSPVQSVAQERYRRGQAAGMPQPQLEESARQFTPSSASSPPVKKRAARPRSVPDAKPRRLYEDPLSAGSAASSGAMRLELGSRPSSMQRSLEGINSMMRAQTMPRFAGPHAGGGGRPYYFHGQQQQQQQYMSQQHHYAMYQQRQASLSPKEAVGGVQPSASSDSAQQQQQQAIAMPPGPPPQSARNVVAERTLAYATAAKQDSTSTQEADGKENSNATATSKSGGRGRGPCNCKKSKCLKLYCECFSQERFCDGCKCLDCNNRIEFQAVREKAMKEIRSKNSKAFQPRITSAQGGPSMVGQHRMGCRCKKSECLKKYCECFQAGILCGTACKCANCMNCPGSQKLIDKRRKMNDKKGAEYAMRVSEERWKGANRQYQQPAALKPAPAGPSRRVSMSSPAHGMMPNNMGGMRPATMMQPSPASVHAGGPSRHGPHHQGMTHQHYMRHAAFMSQQGPPRQHHMGYSPMPPITPGYGGGDPRMMGGEFGGHAGFPPPSAANMSGRTSAPPVAAPSTDVPETAPSTGATAKRPPPSITPGTTATKAPGTSTATSKRTAVKTKRPASSITPATVLTTRVPRTPGTRLVFDVASSRKKRKTAAGSTANDQETTFPYFGSTLPQQPKTAALNVFSFLADIDLYKAAQVCKQWKLLATDEELWKREKEAAS